MVSVADLNQTGIKVPEPVREELTNIGAIPSPPHTTLPVHWLYEAGNRFDANYYSDNVTRASYILEHSGLQTSTLKQLGVQAYHPTQNQPRSNFKRIFASPDKGVPFLTTSELYAFRPVTRQHLSRKMIKLHELMVEPGALLLSRSGTVANPVLVSKRLSQYAVSDDALRVESGDLQSGYLYAFLSSWIGRALEVISKVD